MWFGEAKKLRELEIAEVTVGEQIWQNVVPVLVPCASRRLGVAANNHLELGIRRVRSEIFVRIHVDISRMIDREQTHLIEIHSFFQRLHETETYSGVPHPCRGVS